MYFFRMLNKHLRSPNEHTNISIIMTMSVKVIYVVIFSNLATLLRIHDKLKNSNQEGEKSYFPETAICKGT